MSKHSKIRVGVRDNRLGKILGEQVIELLHEHLPSASFTIVPVPDPAHRGRPSHWPGYALERALADGEIDIAVQNMKDVSPEPPCASRRSTF
jgi:porphobilinogen deaminase